MGTTCKHCGEAIEPWLASMGGVPIWRHADYPHTTLCIVNKVVSHPRAEPEDA